MSGFVYFIEREPGDYVKIGWTKYGPADRLSQLQTGCPDLLYVRAFFPGSLEDERRMHLTFADLRGRGEWFANILKLADFLQQLDKRKSFSDEASCSSLDDVAQALHDQVMQGGGWYPDYPVSELVYDDSGVWEPWRSLLWEKFGPWEE